MTIRGQNAGGSRLPLVVALLSVGCIALGCRAEKPAPTNVAKPAPQKTVVAPVPAPVAPTIEATNAVALPPPEPVLSPIERFTLLFDGGKVDEALALVESELVRKPKDMDLLLAKGAALRRKRDHSAAIQLYDQVLNLKPEDQTAVNLQCLLNVELARETTDPAAAVKFLAAAVRFIEKDPSVTITSEYAAKLADTGNVAEALRVYDTLPQGSGEVPAALTLNVARLCREARLPDKAERLYRAALAQVPNSAEAALGLAMTLRDQGRDDEALAALDLGLASNADDLRLLDARAALELKKKDLCAAVRTYDRILALRPEDAAAAGQKARLLVEIGCYGLALEFVQSHKTLVDDETRRTVEDKAEAQRKLWEQVPPAATPDPALVALCYQDIPASPTDAPFAVDVRSFVGQIEYLRARDYQFIGFDSLLAAKNEVQPLPAKAALLTFDGGYASFVSNALPVLQLYGYRSVVAVCTRWMEEKSPEGARPPLMTWGQVKSVGSNALVTVASFSHGLDAWVPKNPQGDVGPAATTRLYDPRAKSYETEAQYRRRIADDLAQSLAVFERRTQLTPQVLAWPLGAVNAVAMGEAAAAGFSVCLSQQTGSQSPAHLCPIARWTVPGAASITEFIAAFHSQAERTDTPETIRAVDVNLDLLAAPSPAETEQNIRLLVARLMNLGVNTVYVQGFSDPDRDGNAEAVYFPNRVLPVRQDLLSHLTDSLKAMGLCVYVKMPTLSFVLPDKEQDRRLEVMQSSGDGTRLSTLWAKRLSPFHARTAEIVSSLYEDLAAFVSLDGVVFGADAFLTDREDFSPAAIQEYGEILGMPAFSVDTLDKQTRQAWTRAKTRQLIVFTGMLEDAVRRYSPQARFARCLFAPALHHPGSENWLAQNYEESLKAYDRVILLADPEIEGVSKPLPWLTELVRKASQYPDGLSKTVFELPAYDLQRSHWIRERDLVRRFRQLLGAGAWHVAYAEDDWQADRPRLRDMRPALALPSASLADRTAPRAGS